ncbi:MAG: tRNA (N6-isopentenyl adenosine(37)-C2)-methylthiotransferase MiaB, partial [Endomicrobiaceae bacterium]|nr:tRNA (N6-isopentenyl adenosine(37)-C2)-methylthiotransferase MiaB [Endomicrobiaceae bacterium]
NNMNFFMETIGCQMNVNDSDKISNYLIDHGCVLTLEISQADIVILNTCSVRFSAEHKAYSFLGRIKEQKDINPNLIIGVVGCMAQYAYKEIKRRCKYVDFILGAQNIDDFSQIISKYIPSNYLPREKVAKEVFQYVTIMKGCTNFCSYCIVPYVRGPEFSINRDEIFNSVKEAVNTGVKEIILLGQNVNSYNDNGVNFTHLLQKISEIENLKRIRFMTNHPKDLSDELIDEIANNNKICKHIHLPLQSASNNILNAMNRKYTYEKYKSLVEKIKSKIPQINITTDIIIGFPGETDQDFQDTFQASKDLKFGGVFIFKYSPRPNTIAAKFKDDVSLEVKKQRHTLLLEDSNNISKTLNNEYIGKNIDVLVEKYNNNICEGRNSQNLKVFFDSKENLTGQIVKVSINRALANSLSGNIIL